ncbi:cellulose synthase A catalytic subunit 1 [Corchorus olitorius]|uniref:Cellulose synthase A catalytic subunit 1 n=1 Tax=Corchorus olitorius TaxID=93759 RepID=A0A1R3K176_9ROSI|nr:cellulose synthase A catalytic subunit 1 [Corchorus olitorius]
MQRCQQQKGKGGEAMEASGGIVAGSHRRNELVWIPHDSDSEVRVLDLPIFNFGLSRQVSVFYLLCIVLFRFEFVIMENEFTAYEVEIALYT